ncbi:DUF6119 family protein [Mesorhizobium sp. B2-3-14]|uniref:DUF6119 family protein n=1 Tax=Mesorhizobium sp. B2-3-14 TaxID=2589950 RepID=UPI0015E32008|nr:DUF6119 family protein [Mesorhizobium sp. B2-3-14]
MAKKTYTIYLAKPNLADFADLLSEGAREKLAARSTRVVEAPEFGDGSRLYVFIGEDSTPPWLRDLRQNFEIPGRIETRSSCALLIFRVSDRLFASSFAHGWMYLNEDNLEGDFGIRAAINAVDDGKLKRLDRANLGDAMRAVSHSPFQREFKSFGLDDALDLVRKIGGSTRMEATADSMTGSRGLRVSGDLTIEDLPELADEALEYYGSDAYTHTSFKVLDVVTPVTDRILIAALDESAAQSIRQGHDDFELGLPVHYEDDGAAYRFLGPGLRRRYPDLLLRNYCAAMGDRLAQLDTQTLRDHKIAAVYDDGRPEQRWSIRSALVGSATLNDARYAVNEGEWYRVDEPFRLSIEASFLDVIQDWEIQPVPLRKIYDQHGNGNYQSEASYNAERAVALGYLLLDLSSVEIPGIQRSGFEPCDILDIEGKRFIHVKKNSRRSNVLSHFFKQGGNSAQQFKRFPAAWTALYDLVLDRNGEHLANRLREVNENDDRKWTIEFWMADAPRANGNFNIPFFSKISLRDEALNLAAMSYNVVVRFIGLEPEAI